MSFQERWYQEESAEAGFQDVISGSDVHPVIAAPTGSGKTPTICKLVEKLVDYKPSSKVLILSHTQSIVEQDQASLIKYTDGLPIGLYAAGLDSRTIMPITVGQIQSVYRKPQLFEDFDLAIIDEAHSVNTEDKGMYRNFLKNIQGNYIGLTATAFRTGYGYIYKGESALFNKLSYDLTSREKFNRIIDEGYLSNLISKRTDTNCKREELTRTVAGDFSTKQTTKVFGRPEITKKCVEETIYYGKNFRKWLCFAIDIAHAEMIKSLFEEYKIKAAVVHSKMKDDFKSIINAHKRGDVKVLINVDMLTTGYDDPEIDLIAMMRPTKSPIVHVQTLGRGSRVVYCPDPVYDLNTIQGRLDAISAGIKPCCLVLDFAGNSGPNGLGPINDVRIKQKGEKVEEGDPITKLCPECDVYNYGAAKFCVNCGHEFKFKERLLPEALDNEIIRRDSRIVKPTKGWVTVQNVSYERYNSNKGNPDCLLVKYKTGLTTVKEYVHIDAYGKPRYRAKNWIKWRWKKMAEAQPDNLNDLLNNVENLKIPREIEVEQIMAGNKYKYTEIHNTKF